MTLSHLEFSDCQDGSAVRIKRARVRPTNSSATDASGPGSDTSNPAEEERTGKVLAGWLRVLKCAVLLQSSSGTVFFGGIRPEGAQPSERVDSA